MRRPSLLATAAAVLWLAVVPLAGCESNGDGPMEEAGEEIDEAVDDAEDALDAAEDELDD
jgi:hypothetical protein